MTWALGTSGNVQRVDITDPNDPQLADYRQLKEARLLANAGKFVAESEVVVKKLLQSALHVDSLLVTEARLNSLASHLRPNLSVYVVPQAVMNEVTGFHIHRGCLAVGRRPQSEIPPNAQRLLVLEDVTDTDNIGAAVRNAAAFGVDAVLLSPRCADAFYRKAIRTSTGHVFSVPIVRLAAWPQDLWALRPHFQIVGATLAARAVPLPQFALSGPLALVMGTEGSGLSANVSQECDALITIPMAPTGDSLNVAVASAVILYALSVNSGP